MANFCKYCGFALTDGAKFCKECGKVVTTLQADAVPQESRQAVNVCKTCGAALNPGAKFCRGCGTVMQFAIVLPQPLVVHLPAQPAPPKTGGWLLPYRIVASLLAVILLITGSVGATNRNRDRRRIPGGYVDNSDKRNIPGGDTDHEYSEEEAEFFSYLDDAFTDERITWLDTSTLTREYIGSAAIGPSAQSTTLDFDGMSVTIPENFTDEPLNVTFSEIKDMPPARDVYYDKVYDLDIGGFGLLPDTIAITLPYNPDLIESTADLVPMIFDDKAGWVACTFSVDEDAHMVTFYTNHLSLPAVGYIISGALVLYTIYEGASTVYDGIKLAHDATTLLSHEYDSSEKNFNIRYRRYGQLIWQIDPEGCKVASGKSNQWLRDNPALDYKEFVDKYGSQEIDLGPGDPYKMYANYINSWGKGYANKCEEFFKPSYAKLDAALAKLGNMLEEIYTVYEAAGYEVKGNRVIPYPVIIGMGGETARSDLAVTLANIFITEEEFVQLALQTSGAKIVEQKLQRLMFKDILWNTYPFAARYTYNFSFVFDQVKPFSWMVSDAFWLNGLYAYVPYTLFIDPKAAYIPGVVNSGTLSKPIKKLTEYEAVLVPYFIEKILDKNLPGVVKYVAQRIDTATILLITDACYADIASTSKTKAVNWYEAFVNFIYKSTPFRLGDSYLEGEHFVSVENGQQIDLSLGNILEDPNSVYDQLFICDGEVSYTKSDGEKIITVEGSGYIEIAVLNPSVDVFAFMGGEKASTMYLNDCDMNDLMLEIDFTTPEHFAAKFYRIKFNTAEWVISPDVIELVPVRDKDYVPGSGLSDFEDIEFDVTYLSERGAVFDVLAYFDGKQDKEYPNGNTQNSISGGDTITFRFRQIPGYAYQDKPPKELHVEIYVHDNMGRKLQYSQKVPLKFAPVPTPTPDSYSFYWPDDFGNGHSIPKPQLNLMVGVYGEGHSGKWVFCELPMTYNGLDLSKDPTPSNVDQYQTVLNEFEQLFYKWVMEVKVVYGPAIEYANNKFEWHLPDGYVMNIDFVKPNEVKEKNASGYGFIVYMYNEVEAEADVKNQPQAEATPPVGSKPVGGAVIGDQIGTLGD